MDIKRRIRPDLVFIVLFIVVTVAYFWTGFQPVDAKKYNIIAKLSIPSIGLDTDVAKISPVNNKLDTPDSIVGGYDAAENKSFLIGHSSTVFANLHSVEVGDVIYYSEKRYYVDDKIILPKEGIDMRELLQRSDEDTIEIMTCAGQDLGGGDATHRLIVTATRR